MGNTPIADSPMAHPSHVAMYLCAASLLLPTFVWPQSQSSDGSRKRPDAVTPASGMGSWPGEYWIKDPDPNIRSKAVFSFAQTSPLSSIPTLSTMTLYDPDAQVRINAARALGQIGMAEAESAVLQLMKRTTSMPVRYELVRALGSFHTPSSSEQLIWELKNSKYNSVRIAALESMGRRAEEAFVPEVSKFASDPDPTVASRAIWVLGEVGNPKATPILVDKLRRSPSVELRRESAMALARIRGNESVPALSETALSKNEHPTVRAAAVNALTRMEGNLKVWGDLLPLAKDPDPQMRSAAAFAIAKNPSKEATASLESLILDFDPFVRFSAVNAVALQSERFAPLLSSVASNKAMALEVRLPAITALGDVPIEQLAGEQVYPHLAKLLDKTDAEVIQIAAINLLRYVGNSRAHADLERFGKEKDLPQTVLELLSTK